MKKRAIILIIGFFLFSVFGIDSIVIASPEGAKQSQEGIASVASLPRNDVILEDIACENGEAYSAVTIATTSPIFYIDYKLSDPANIVIDPQEDVYTNLDKERLVSGGLVEAIFIVEAEGIAPPSLGTSYYPVDFIVVKLKRTAPYKVFQDGNMIRASFGIAPVEAKVVEPSKEAVKKTPEPVKESVKPLREGIASLPAVARNDVPPPVNFILESLSCDNDKDASSIRLKGNKYVDYFVTPRKEIPAKIVIDTIEPIFSNLSDEASIKKPGFVARIRLISAEAKIPPELAGYKAYDFLIVELSREMPHSVSQSENELIVDIGAIKSDKGQSTPAPVAQAGTVPITIKVEATVTAEPVVQLGEAKDIPEGLKAKDVAHADVDALRLKPFVREREDVSQGAVSKVAKPSHKLEVRMPKPEEVPALLAMAPQRIVKVEKPDAAEQGQPPKPKPTALVIDKITWKNEEKAAAVYITTNKETEFALYRLENPARLIVEPLETAYAKIDREYEFNKGTIRSMKLVPKGVPVPSDLGLAYYSVDFLIIQLIDSKPHAAFQDDEKLTVVLGEKEDAMSLYDKEAFRGYLAGGGFIPVEEKEEGAERSGASPEGTVPSPVEAEEEQTTLDRCIELAIGNHKPAQISKQEIELSKMKVRESLRAMFVTPTLKATKTRGIAGQATFDEKKYGVSVEQPIYYSNRLFNTYRQSKMNLKVAKKRYDKTIADLSSRISQLYYAAVSTRHNLKVQMALQNEAKSILASAQKIFEKELTTQLEYLSVESQYSQINYQVATLQRDVQLAELNLKQAMGLEPGVPLDIEDAIDYKEINIDLDESLDLAFANRPELMINKDLVKVGEYEEKIARAKQGLKVDFTGFFGKSGSRSRPDKLKDNDIDHEISMGVQASKQWGGSTASYSFLRDKVSVKPGQSTRTFSETHSADFAVLNALQGYSDTKSAHISYERALNDLIEIERTIRYEVREAYFNIEKARVQIKNYSDKIEIRKKELKIAEMQAGFAEAQLSQVIDSKMKLADEIVAYNQTVSNYYTAIANLNKAIGLAGHYK